MKQILTITNVVTSINATAKDDKYTYNLKYYLSSDNKTLDSITMGILDDKGTYVGTASIDDTKNKSIVVRPGGDFSTINTMFDNIVIEIKAGLATT